MPPGFEIHPPLRQAPLPPARIRPIAIIGAGGIVRDAHLPAYRIAGFPVASIYDVVPERADALARQFGIGRVSGSLDELVACSPDGTVFDCALPASEIVATLGRLPAGAAVLIQKPLGQNLAAALEIRDLCRRRQLKAAVNFQLRHAPYIIAARDAIGRGLIGRVHDMEVRVTVCTPWHMWPFFAGIPRVEILYHSVHYIDLLRSFLGEPAGVHAKTTRDPVAREARLASTRSSILLDYGDELRATITCNHGHDYGPAHQESYVKWEGECGAITARLGVLLDYPRGVPDRLEICVRRQGSAPEWQEIAVEGSWFPHAFIGTMASLMRYVNGEAAELPTSVEDACRTMAVVEAAYGSSASGGTPVPAA